MPKILWADTETRSANDIKRGAYVYAEDSELLLFLYALDDGPVHVWQPHLADQLDVPAGLHAALSDSSVEIRYHNNDFDHTQMQAWPWCRGYDLNPMRFFCTMVAMRMAGLPGSLDEACKALGLPVEYAKKDGNALIRKFCIPNAKTGQYTRPEDDPEAWKKFVEYGVQDVVSMRECMKRIPQVFTQDERVFYAYTKVMNDRGVPIDRELAYQGMVQSDALKARYKKEGETLGRDYTDMKRAFGTGKEKELSITSQKAILEFLKSYGVNLPDARGSTLEEFLDSPQADLLPPNVIQVLATRIKANKAATSKYKAIIAGLSSDSRCRGTISFYGAQRTGRDAGRRIQPQNLARPVLVGSDSRLRLVENMEIAADYVKKGLAELLFEEPLQLMSDCVRGTIAATKGNKLCQADLANIEGRVCPWLAGEQKKLDYFFALDRGQIKFDNYVMAYAGSFNISPAEVTKQQRQVGKVQELASLYGGSVGAYITFATAFGIDIDKLGLGILENADPYYVLEARKKLDWYKKNMTTYGLADDVWVGIMAAVLSWRASHAFIQNSWYRAEDAFKAAINNPGVTFDMAHLTTCVSINTWMLVKLPSGRTLVYPNARLEGEGRKARLVFTSVNPFTKKWGTVYTGGPRLIENLTQAMARDCLFYNIPATEAAGYPIVMRVHDELICETPDLPQFSGEHLAEIIGKAPAWAPGLPMSAAGETYYRYQK